MTGEQLQPDEIVYRRIPFVHLPNPKFEPLPVYRAFMPHKSDITGISLWRAQYKTAEEAAKGVRPGKRYHVAKLLVRDLNKIGLTVIKDKIENDPGHAAIPELRRAVYEADKKNGTNNCKNWADMIITSVAEIVLVALDMERYPDLPEIEPNRP